MWRRQQFFSVPGRVRSNRRLKQTTHNVICLICRVATGRGKHAKVYLRPTHGYSIEDSTQTSNKDRSITPEISESKEASLKTSPVKVSVDHAKVGYVDIVPQYRRM